MVIEYAASRSRIELIPYDEAYGAGFEDMHRRVPDTQKLRQLTGWTPRYSLHDVLNATIAEVRGEAVTKGQLIPS